MFLRQIYDGIQTIHYTGCPRRKYKQFNVQGVSGESTNNLFVHWVITIIQGIPGESINNSIHRLSQEKVQTIYYTGCPRKNFMHLITQVVSGESTNNPLHRVSQKKVQASHYLGCHRRNIYNALYRVSQEKIYAIRYTGCP